LEAHVVKNFLAVVAGVAAVVLGGQPAAAAPILTLSTPADLANPTVGQTVMFDVTLSGLNAGDTLDVLQATVVFDAAQFGTPTAITPGAIIPDANGFFTATAPGLADATYDEFFGTFPQITSNGVFFSFDVVVQATGSSTISFDFVSSLGADANGDPLPPAAAGPPLNVGPNTVVPEPGTFLLLALGGVGATVLGRRLRDGGTRSVS
jgi:hypothetical protein